MRICYYVTGHGYGHAVRTAQVIKALPESVSVILRTVVPVQLFREEVPGRSFLYLPAEFDCGCVQSDSVTVLPRATLNRYRELNRANSRRLSHEIQFLREQAVDLVVSDIPSFPLHAAQEAGLPRFAVANFTWHDIYRPYQEQKEDSLLLIRMAKEYASATLAFVTPLSTVDVRMPFPHVQEVPLVARTGRNVKDRLQEFAGRQKLIALLYFGAWGLDLNWDALDELRDWIFLTFDSPENLVPANVIRLSRNEWRCADVAASVDVVISKAGYGTVTECIANNVPLIYLPRSGFAEYDALVLGMEPWGGGVQLAEHDFRKGNWQASLTRSQLVKRNSKAYAVNGAQVIAEHFVKIAGAK